MGFPFLYFYQKIWYTIYRKKVDIMTTLSAELMNQIAGSFDPNQYELLGEGADRVVYALDSNWVVKVEDDTNSQNLEEIDTYELYKYTGLVTTILHTPYTLEAGMVFAERVLPLYNALPPSVVSTLLEHYSSIDELDEGLYEVVDLKWHEEVSLLLMFAEQVSNLHDLHFDNIGRNNDGDWVVLDLGYGSDGW